MSNKPLKISSEKLSPEGKEALKNYLRQTGQLIEESPKKPSKKLSPEDKENLKKYLRKTGQLIEDEKPPKSKK